MQEYYDVVIKSFAETALHEPVKYKVRDIANKMALLDREVKYLINKAKIWRPKQETATNHTENANENATDTKEGSEPESVPKSGSDSQKEAAQDESEASADAENEKPVEPTGSDEPTVTSEDKDARSSDDGAQEPHQEL